MLDIFPSYSFLFSVHPLQPSNTLHYTGYMEWGYGFLHTLTKNTLEPTWSTLDFAKMIKWDAVLVSYPMLCIITLTFFLKQQLDHINKAWQLWTLHHVDTERISSQRISYHPSRFNCYLSNFNALIQLPLCRWMHEAILYVYSLLASMLHTHPLFCIILYSRLGLEYGVLTWLYVPCHHPRLQ